jgi:hypothetical protein
MSIHDLPTMSLVQFAFKLAQDAQPERQTRDGNTRDEEGNFIGRHGNGTV